MEIPDAKPFQHVLWPSQVSKDLDMNSNVTSQSKYLDSNTRKGSRPCYELSNMGANTYDEFPN